MLLHFSKCIIYKCFVVLWFLKGSERFSDECVMEGFSQRLELLDIS